MKPVRVGSIIVVLGLVLLFSAFTRTATPMTLLDQYELLTGPTSRTLKTAILPPQTLRLELTLNQGLSVGFMVQTLQNYSIFVLDNISHITYTHQIPVRTAYKLTLTNPYPVMTLVRIKVTMYGPEPDFLLAATTVTVLGTIIVTICLSLPVIRKRHTKTPTKHVASTHLKS